MTVLDQQTNGVTPAEEDFPLIISVDDHILEPRDLWQNELPASVRDRGPRVVREKVKLDFKGGNYGFERDVADGTWCDLWLFDDLVLAAPVCSTPPVGCRPTSSSNIPAIYEDFRPGAYDQTARLADMDANHVEVGDQLPEHLPPLRRPGLRRARRQGPRARLPPDLQRLDDRRLVRRRRPRVG